MERNNMVMGQGKGISSSKSIAEKLDAVFGKQSEKAHFVDVMERIRARELVTLDAWGRIAFGKYMFTRFEDVPLEYYCWATRQCQT